MVIPVFNRLGLLREAVESCLAQTYPNVEVIIIDDGSTDETRGFLAGPLPSSWPGRVTCCRQDSAGASAARNEGLSRARGKYVQFLDSDDILLRDKIRAQVERLESGESTHEVCSCYGRLEGLEGLEGEAVASRRVGIQCGTPAEYVRALCGPMIHGMPTCGPLWSADLLRRQSGWSVDVSLGDDLEYYVRLLVRVHGVDFVDDELFIVREHGGARLSDATGDLSRVLSAVKAHQRIVETVSQANLGNAVVERSLARKGRSLYFNLLKLGGIADLKAFEAWVRSSGQERHMDVALKMSVCLRRCIGRRMASAALTGLIRLKQTVRRVA